MDAEQEAERNFYLSEVVTAFVRAHVHAPTEDCPEGLLPENAALSLGLRLLYSPPAAPADPAQDNTVIMSWLTTILNFVPVIAGAVREAREAAAKRAG
jgi:hypothetical protein